MFAQRGVKRFTKFVKGLLTSATSASSIYTGLPLNPERNEIRLLDIYPTEQQDGSPEVPVRCQLRRVDFDNGPDFIALSYTWEDEATRADIFVNGTLTSVTANLESALQHLRHADDIVTIWADALCINQADNIEKAYQVGRMHDVYSKARRTIIWLGLEGDGSDMAMRALRDTGSQSLECGLLDHGISQLTAGFASQDPKFQSLRDLRVATGWAYPFKAVKIFYDRRYWSRLWVLQEYALAPDIVIQCGKDTMDGDQFHAGLLFLAYLAVYLTSIVTDDDISTPVPAGTDYGLDKDERDSRVWHMMKSSASAKSTRAGGLIGVRRQHALWQQSPGSTPQSRLSHLLERTNSQETKEPNPPNVKDPRDKIFGLLGLLGQNVELGFAIDYQVSAEELYTDAMRWLVLCSQMQLLSFSRIHSHTAMPSWSPDWRQRLRAPNTEQGLFKPSGEYKGQAVRAGDKIIRFRAVLLDSVACCAGFWQPENRESEFFWEDAQCFLAEVETLMAAQKDVPPMLPDMSPEQWREGAWRIPIADQYSDDLGMRMRAPMAAKAGWDAVKLGRPARAAEGDRLSETTRYRLAMTRLHRRRLAWTRQGLIGLMPADAEVGDVVSIVLGAKAPLLLRPRSKDGAYQIVGESYVYGVMDGEAITKDTLFTDIDIC
ncbi:hypothetical protein LTR42_011667 [Elasticomyces elasticus]|nr:hypothetical protein LTR42_011667 [Elasticomyces elasticus]